MTVTAILWNLFSALAVIILVAMLKDIHITVLTYCSSWDVLHSLRHDCISICWPALIMTLSEYEVQLRERRYAVQYRIFDSLPSFHSA